MVGDSETQLTQGSQENNFPEHRKKAANLIFQHRIRRVLKELTRGIPKLRVLDYGAGAIPCSLTDFSTLQGNQETVAYDPCLSESTYTEYRDALTEVPSGIRWTKNLPVEEKFDLTICHFSLHHIDKSLKKALKELRGYSPIIAVVDYDFTEATLAEFKNEFISELEQKELQVVFEGDWEECFAFHSRYGLSTYEKALKKNRFDTASEFGKGIAGHKFLLIGIPHSPFSKLALSFLK